MWLYRGVVHDVARARSSHKLLFCDRRSLRACKRGSEAAAVGKRLHLTKTFWEALCSIIQNAHQRRAETILAARHGSNSSSRLLLLPKLLRLHSPLFSQAASQAVGELLVNLHQHRRRRLPLFKDLQICRTWPRRQRLDPSLGSESEKRAIRTLPRRKDLLSALRRRLPSRMPRIHQRSLLSYNVQALPKRQQGRRLYSPRMQELWRPRPTAHRHQRLSHPLSSLMTAIFISSLSPGHTSESCMASLRRYRGNCFELSLLPIRTSKGRQPMPTTP